VGLEVGFDEGFDVGVEVGRDVGIEVGRKVGLEVEATVFASSATMATAATEKAGEAGVEVGEAAGGDHKGMPLTVGGAMDETGNVDPLTWAPPAGTVRVKKDDDQP